MTKIIALLGAFDTKGPEYAFVKQAIEARGHAAFLIDVGVMDSAELSADVTSAHVAEAGGADLATLVARKDRGEAVAAMMRGAEALLPKLYAEGKFDGILAMGGSGGSAMACAAMRALPLGVPKVMVSTVAGGDVSAYVGVKDIVMIPSIVDVAGINKISRGVFTKAAGAICGMVEAEVPEAADKPLIVASMFGNTTEAVGTAQTIFEAAGYEVLVFHCTGNGGRTMESLIETGQVAGVFDITTTEWADEVLGGVLSAGPARLEAAAKCGVPAIVVPGCLDMANFWAPDSIPEQYKTRRFYAHNPTVTLIRTNIEENRELGGIMAAKLNRSTGPLTVLLPRQGLSVIDSRGGPFWWPEADDALFTALKDKLRGDIDVIEMDYNVNDTPFATKCAEVLLESIK